MFVEDPIDTIRALCEHHNDVITNESYIETYTRIKNLKKVGETKAETHLGTLRIYGLVEQIPSMPDGNNQITIKGKTLCELLQNGNDIMTNKKFQNALANLLLTNSYKGNLFKEFIEFIKNGKLKKEIKSKYKWRTGLTLIAWSVAAGLAKQDDEYVIKIPYKINKELSLEKIWKEVRKAYDEIRIFGSDKKRLFVDFSDLRYRAAGNLHLVNYKEFDKLFLQLMQSKYKKYINLHGAPTGEYDEMKNFLYKGRLYPYLSIVNE